MLTEPGSEQNLKMEQNQRGAKKGYMENLPPEKATRSAVAILIAIFVATIVACVVTVILLYNLIAGFQN